MNRVESRNREGQWSHGLFSCFDNFSICVTAFLLPCVVFGQNADTIGEGVCIICACVWLLPLVNILPWLAVRSKIREEFGIDGTILGDCRTICLCPLCALSQEAMELYIDLGMDMSRQ